MQDRLSDPPQHSRLEAQPPELAFESLSRRRWLAPVDGSHGGRPLGRVPELVLLEPGNSSSKGGTEEESVSGQTWGGPKELSRLVGGARAVAGRTGR
jgi:hypothetical protein